MNVVSISQLINRTIVPEVKERNVPKVRILSEPIDCKSSKETEVFEALVFNSLLAARRELGIKTLAMFAALRVDGALELMDGRRLALEIKYRMSWETACKAEYELRQFLQMKEAKDNPVSGGVVIFQEFSGDWSRKPASNAVQNGWNNWYRTHAVIEGLRVDLLRFSDGNFEGYPSLGC